MMPSLISQVKNTWLDSAVPASLDGLPEYRKALVMVKDFADRLTAFQWDGADELNDWVANAHKIWLTKRREVCLDWTRNQLALGKTILFTRL